MASNSKTPGLKPKPVRIVRQRQTMYKCIRCGKDYNTLNQFAYAASNLYEGWEHHFPICRNCMNEVFEYYYDYYENDEERAMRRVCQIFDIYYNTKLIDMCAPVDNPKGFVSKYIQKANLMPHKGKTFDITLQEENVDILKDLLTVVDEDDEINISKAARDRWGVGIFTPDDYPILEEHYKMLKKNNPNADSNQEIFIKSLCHLNLLMMKALKASNLDGYAKANSEYTKTFKQAGLKTVEEKDNSVNETVGVTLAAISQFTPEEFYKDKKLYEDYDKIGEYYERHVLRPMKNIMTGSEERDSRYYVPDVQDEDDSDE